MVIQHADFSLREWNGNSVGFESIPKRKVDVATDVREAVGRVGNPKTQDLVDRTVPKTRDAADGRLCRQDTVNACGSFIRQFAHQVRIVAVGRAEMDVEPDKII